MTTDSQNILSRLLNQELSDQELLQLRKDPDLAPMVDIIEETGQWDTPEFGSTEKAWQQIAPQIKPARVRTLRPLFWAAAVAAVIAIFILVVNAPQASTPDSWSTAAMESKTITLPDGSTVTLNAGSELELQGNWDELRAVLLNGSAFFEVEKGATFSVITDQGLVQVLGTQFEVISDKDQYVVKCFEGSVSVLSPQATETVLTTGQGVRLMGSSWENLSFTAEFPSWTTGNTSFTSAPIREVLNAFERQYGVEVVYEDDLREYTGAFPNDDVEAALQIILRPMNLEVSSTEGNRIHLRKMSE